MSITLAAEDLHVTQSAVSRQIRALEAHLGVPLLVRGFRSVSFTSEGARLFRMADIWLAQLGDLTEQLRAPERRTPVTVTTTIGVASLWLLPRLGDFQAAHRTSMCAWRPTTGSSTSTAKAWTSPSATVCATPCPTAPPGCSANRWCRWRTPRWTCAAWTRANCSATCCWNSTTRAGPGCNGPNGSARGLSRVRPKGMLRFNQYDQIVHAALAGHGIALAAWR